MHQHVAHVQQDDLEPAKAVGEFPSFFRRCATRRLTWWPDLGVGYYPVEAGIEPYDTNYFERFTRQADTPIGRRLMTARLEFVSKHYDGPLVDVGIGSGAFIELRNKAGHATFGNDVNEVAIAWLNERGLFKDPWRGCETVSFWDVLEHIADFPTLLAGIREWVFVSIPIFTDADHVLRSKHYRKDEHVWYFTTAGIVNTFDRCGFDLVDMNTMETDIGREDIGSFAFRRRV